MNYLLDTHTFIWLDDDRDRLSEAVMALISDETNTILLSHVSILEMQIKINIGKMSFPVTLEQKVAQHQQVNRTTLLPITLKHIYKMSGLPAHHGDPFDRLLIAQAMEDDLPILSRDSQFTKYPIRVIW